MCRFSVDSMKRTLLFGSGITSCRMAQKSGPSRRHPLANPSRPEISYALVGIVYSASRPGDGHDAFADALWPPQLFTPACPRISGYHVPDRIGINSLSECRSQLVETDITAILEDALSGIEGLRTLRSSSREGLSTIAIEFTLTRNLDAATNDVRDRVARVLTLLPRGIEPPLVMKSDSEADGIMWLALISDRHSELEITDFAERQIKDRLSSLPGVSSVMLDGGRRYAMRVWLHPDRLASRLLTVEDVEDALMTQNVSIPTGRIESTQREFSVRMGGGLEKPAQFNQLILAYRDGYPIRLQDVGSAEIGAEDDRKLVRVNGRSAVGLGIMKQSKANTLEATRAVKQQLPALEASLADGMKLVTAFDSSIYIEHSLHEVYLAVGLSLTLVVLVVFFFLRSFRATLIPTVAIPGSILEVVDHARDFLLDQYDHAARIRPCHRTGRRRCHRRGGECLSTNRARFEPHASGDRRQPRDRICCYFDHSVVGSRVPADCVSSRRRRTTFYRIGHRVAGSVLLSGSSP